jgi:hypothetical protein
VMGYETTRVLIMMIPTYSKNYYKYHILDVNTILISN